MKVQPSGRLVVTTPGESGDEMTVSVDERPPGPSDALFAEIAFILAEAQRLEGASVD